jgi:type IV secretion system protein VirB10
MPPLPGAAPTPLDPHVLSTAGQADRWKLNNRIEKPASKYILQTGWLIPALMISGMESQLPGSIIAQVSQDIFDSPSGKYLLIPKGTQIFGEYANSIAFGQSRIFVAWQRLIFPNGNTLDISAMPGADSEGEAGFHDLTDSHLLTIFGSALLMSAISGATALSQPQQTFSNAPNLESTLSAALGQQLGAATTALLEKNLSVPPKPSRSAKGTDSMWP